MTGKELPCKGKIPKNIIVRNQENPFDKISNTFYLRKLPPSPPVYPYCTKMSITHTECWTQTGYGDWLHNLVLHKHLDALRNILFSTTQYFIVLYNAWLACIILQWFDLARRIVTRTEERMQRVQKAESIWLALTEYSLPPGFRPDICPILFISKIFGSISPPQIYNCFAQVYHILPWSILVRKNVHLDVRFPTKMYTYCINSKLEIISFPPGPW